MRVINKSKAVKLCNEYLSVLIANLDRTNKAYLYIHSWVECEIMYGILDNLSPKIKGWYYQRTDWEKVINDLDDYINCRHIDENIKKDALKVLTSNNLMELWATIKTCFR